jgi:biotin transport system permease protein
VSVELGLYRPGRSVLHRTRPGLKLLLLLAAGAGSVLLDRPWQVAAALLAVLAGYAVAGLPVRAVARQARPLGWLLLAVGGFHAVVSGWERAVVVTGAILGLVLLAGLVTLTTRTTELVDTVGRALRPLRRLGVDTDRVGLLLALGIRSVPVVLGIARDVRDAQWARGVPARPTTYAVPLVIRSLRHADSLGEALVARGIDD